MHIETVNGLNTSWIANKSPRFENMSEAEIKSMMGTIVDPNWAISAEPMMYAQVIRDLPAEFDARVNFPQCADVIGHVRD